MADDPTTPNQTSDIQPSDDRHSDEHPLASPTELAGSTEGAIAAEFAARDAEEALDADAAGAMAGAQLEEDSLPLDGE
jgi:hypothetical protein